MQNPAKVFARDATGLVREFGALDTLLFASVMVFALVFTTTQFAWFYGNTLGANLTETLLVATIPFIFLMLAYWAIGITMPRSGNDYVWISRVFHPSIGFAWSLFYMIIVFLVAYVGEIGPFSYAISAAMTILGLQSTSSSLTNLGTFLGGPLGTLELASLFTIIFGVFALFGTRFIKGILYVTWVAAIVGIVLMWYILGTTSTSAFISHWNTFLSSGNSSLTYAGLQQAGSNGFPGMATGFGAIGAALPLAFLFLFGGNYANGFAGEIKNVKRSIPIALFLSLVFGVLYWSITSSLTLNTVGSEWMTIVGHAWDNSGVSSSAYPLAYAPSQPLLLAVAAYPNNALITLMFGTYIVGSIGALFTYFWVPSKYFFAWSFDRVLPTKFADVSQRFHTSYLSVIVIVVLGIALSYFYAFLGYSTYFTMGSVLWGAAYVIPGLALVVFPFAKKDVFSQAPGWVSKKAAGVPLISLVGIAVTVGFAIVAAEAYNNPAIGTANTFSIGLAVALVLIGFVIYFISASYHKAKGMDLGMALKEIPPE
ncbi:MAG: APC family permease [Nitrososphaerota archaeon]|nr:APC family permease [Nitrososphaerota archaeon]